MEVASRIVVMNKGVVEQLARLQRCRAPAVIRVALSGHVNIFHGRVDRDWLDLNGWRVPAPEGIDARDEIAVCATHDVQITREAERSTRSGIRHVHNAVRYLIRTRRA